MHNTGFEDNNHVFWKQSQHSSLRRLYSFALRLGRGNGIDLLSSVSASPAIGFTAQFNFGFSQVILVGTLNGNFLTVESFTEFTDSRIGVNYCASMT